MLKIYTEEEVRNFAINTYGEISDDVIQTFMMVQKAKKDAYLKGYLDGKNDKKAPAPTKAQGV